MTLNALRARARGQATIIAKLSILCFLFSFSKNEGGAEKKNISPRSNSPMEKQKKFFDFSVFRFAAGNGNSRRESSGCCCAVLYYRGQMRAARKMSPTGFNRKCCNHFIGLRERL